MRYEHFVLIALGRIKPEDDIFMTGADKYFQLKSTQKAIQGGARCDSGAYINRHAIAMTCEAKHDPLKQWRHCHQAGHRGTSELWSGYAQGVMRKEN